MSNERESALEMQGVSVDVAQVKVRLLKQGISPRIEEQDVEHAKALAHVLDDCPPIIVERSSNVIVDGVHRVLAARMIGRSEVPVRYFDGTHEDAYVEAVKCNVQHGKPLTLTERESAARKILGIKCEWSDRRIGQICGLSGKTIGKLRRTTEDIPQLTIRIGRDGRQRPADPGKVRKQIESELEARPDVRPAVLAHELSTSPSTVRDVKRQMEHGHSLEGATPSVPTKSKYPNARPNRTVESHRWAGDQAIRSMPDGVIAGEWLDATAIEATHWTPLVVNIPLNRIPELIDLAQSRSKEWQAFALELEGRARQLSRNSKRRSASEVQST
jgi:ParB-like chromosome segregation protein Spo0J